MASWAPSEDAAPVQPAAPGLRFSAATSTLPEPPPAEAEPCCPPPGAEACEEPPVQAPRAAKAQAVTRAAAARAMRPPAREGIECRIFQTLRPPAFRQMPG